MFFLYFQIKINRFVFRMKDDGPIDKMHESGSFFYNQFPPNNIQIIERNQFSKERVNVKFTDSSPLLIQMGKFIQRLIV